jgi:hypothetical protein
LRVILALGLTVRVKKVSNSFLMDLLNFTIFFSITAACESVTVKMRSVREPSSLLRNC